MRKGTVTMYRLASISLFCSLLFASCAPAPDQETPDEAQAVAKAEQTLPPGIVSKAEPTTFLEAVGKINATPAFLDALAQQPDTGPTINLNLLRYRPRGDSSRYDLYGAVAGQEIVGLGGDIIYHGFDDGVVYLRMQGACAGCPASSATLKMGIENMLRHYIPEVVEVRAVL